MTRSIEYINEASREPASPARLSPSADMGTATGNTYRQDWLLLEQNPWIGPGALAFVTQAAESNPPPDPLIERARAALRRWMDENPY